MLLGLLGIASLFTGGGFIDGLLKAYLAAAVQQKPIEREMEDARDFLFSPFLGKGDGKLPV